MIVTLSCQCIREFTSSPPFTGEWITCTTDDGEGRWHGAVCVTRGREKNNANLKCDNCKWNQDYNGLASLTVCTYATKHMIKYRHTVRHAVYDLTNPDNEPRLCVHAPTAQPVFADGAPPF